MQSSLVEEKIIPYLQPLIKEKSGFDLQLERFRFDLFGHLSLNNLSLKKIDRDSNETIDFGLKKLNLDYDIWRLLDKQIVIKELSLEDLKLYGSLPFNKASTEEAPSEDKSASFSQEELLNLITKPPVVFDLHAFNIAPIDIDVEFYDKEKKLHYKSNLAFHSATHWSSSKLYGTIALSMNHTLLELVKNATTKLVTHPTIDSKINWKIKNDKEKLLLELKPTELILGSGKTHLTHYQTDKKIELALENWNSTLVLKGVSELLNPTRTNLAWELQQDLLTSNSSVELNDTSISMDPLNVQLNLQGSIGKVANQEHQVALKNRLKLDLDPMQITLMKENLSLIATPDYHLNLDTKIALESDGHTMQLKPEHSQANFVQHLNFNHFELHQEKNNLSIDQQKWKLIGNFEKNQIFLTSDFNLKELSTPFVLKKFSLQHQLSLGLDSKFKELNLDTTLTLDKLAPLVNLSLNVDNAPQNLQLNPLIKLNLPQSLDQYIKEAQTLHKVGDINIDFNAKVQIPHDKHDAFDLNWSQYRKMPFKSDMKLMLKQLQPPTEGSLQIKGPLKTELLLSKSSLAHYKSKVFIKSDGIFYPPLKKPLPLNLWIDTSSNQSLSDIHSKANIVINHQPFIKYTLHLTDKPKDFSLKSRWNIHTNTKWKSFLSQLQPLEKVGNIHLQNQFDINISHPFKTLQLVNPSKLQALNLTAEFDGSLKQDDYDEKAQILISKPLAFKHTIKWQEQSASLDAIYNIKEMSLVDKLNLKELSLAVSLDANHGLKPNALIANIESNGTRVALLSDKKPPLEVISLLLPLSLSLDGKLNQDANNLNLKKLQLSLGDGWFEQHVKGSIALDGNNSEINAQTLFHLRDQLFKAPLPPLSGSGTLSVPWQIRFLESQWLALKSELIFENLSFSSNELLLSGINGKIPLSEEITLQKDGNISFEYLLNTDPFQRVDFNQIQPYLNNQEKLHIQTIKFGNTTVGPMQATIPIEQNLIQLQQFNLKLFGGHIAGEFYLNTAPKAWIFGLLMRVTQIDLRQALKESTQFRSSPISARVALEFDFSKRLLEGQIDITDIDESQLLQLLELLDPEHQDAQIAQVRDALGYAHPESVVITMDGGLLNLSLSLSLMSNPITIRGLPLSPLIERFAGDILNQVNQLPLQ